RASSRKTWRCTRARSSARWSRPPTASTAPTRRWLSDIDARPEADSAGSGAEFSHLLWLRAAEGEVQLSVCLVYPRVGLHEVFVLARRLCAALALTGYEQPRVQLHQASMRREEDRLDGVLELLASIRTIISFQKNDVQHQLCVPLFQYVKIFLPYF